MQMRPTQDSGPPARPVPSVQSGSGRVLNQPSRTGPPSAPTSPSRQIRSLGSSDSPPTAIPQGPTFFSARAAAMIPESRGAEGLPPAHPSNLPVFNPHTESPSIRKTPGIDHRSSKPLTRDLKHVPGSTHATAAAGPPTRTNIVNPQLDTTRRIGAPGSPSPMSNRGSYKPPTMKRTSDGANAVRYSVGDIPANGTTTTGDAGGEAKRQRLNG